MSQHINKSKFKETGCDIVYKDPFSSSTSSIRRKLMIFSSLTILNHYFPIDLSNSHLLGIHFASQNVPTLSGLFGCIVAYFTITLIFYTVQEIKSWLAQANEMQFVIYKTELQTLMSDSQTTNSALIGANQNIELNTSKVVNIEGIEQREKDTLNVHWQSFINFVQNLTEPNKKHISAVNTAADILQQAQKDYNQALYTQAIKVGVLEILIPFAMASFSIYFSYSGILSVLNVVFD